MSLAGYLPSPAGLVGGGGGVRSGKVGESIPTVTFLLIAAFAADTWVIHQLSTILQKTDNPLPSKILSGINFGVRGRRILPRLDVSQTLKNLVCCIRTKSRTSCIAAGTVIYELRVMATRPCKLISCDPVTSVR